MSERLTYEGFCKVADLLFYEAMEMPTANKTYKAIQYGSMATHQLYLSRWKEERKRKPATIPEQLENMLVQKTKQLADDVWSTLSKGNKELIDKIKSHAEENVTAAEEATILAHIERENALDELTRTKTTLVFADQKLVEFTECLQQSQKLLFAAEEAKVSLLEQLKEAKHTFQHQIEQLKAQHDENLIQLKDQHHQSQKLLRNEIVTLKEASANTAQTHQEQITAMQESLHSINNEKANIVRENLTLSGRIEVMQSQVVKSQQHLEEMLAEKTTMQKYQQELEIASVKINTELLQLKEQVLSYKELTTKQQEQLLEYSIKIGGLEEKLVSLKKAKIRKAVLVETTAEA